MNWKRIWKLIIVLASATAIYFGGMFMWQRFYPAAADFFVRLIMPFAILNATLAALFGEYLREKIFPIDLCIEDPKERNTVIDQHQFNETRIRDLCPELLGKTLYVYCHHLRVRNLTHRPMKDCRVWLKKVEVKNLAGEWIEEHKLAVPRMMEWAPFEYSRDKRTFSTQQVFDFGQTLANNNGFLLSFERDQGGAFKPLFSVGKKVRFYFYATAENYRQEKEFCFEIEVPESVQGEKVTPARVENRTEAGKNPRI